MSSNNEKTEPTKYKTPLEIPYMKILVFSLNTIGAWPHEVLGHKYWFSGLKNSKFLFCFWCLVLYLCGKYLKENFGVINFLDLGRAYLNVLMCAYVVHRISTTWSARYKKSCKDFITEMHLFYFKDKSEYSLKIYREVEKISSYFTFILHFEVYFGNMLYCLTPLYNSYHRGMFRDVPPANASFDHSVFYHLPFDYTTNLRGFLIIYVVNFFVCFDVASCFAVFDLFIFVIVFHLWGHLKILQQNLRNFPKPEMKGVQKNPITNPLWYDKEESTKITSMLIDSMKHYKIIKDFMDEVSMAFGATICVYYLLHQVIGCTLLLEITQMNPEAIAGYGMLTITAFQQLIQMSIVFELIGSQSETIKDAVYEVPWECMDTKNRKIVLTYLCNVQEPMNFKALGIVPVGVKTMASILKTSISYFMLLRTITAAEH